jgi:uncharacterized protein (TIGR00369 family)
MEATPPEPGRRFGSPAHEWLGLEPLERSASAAEIRLSVRPEFLQEEGVVQGGILAALLDATCVYALYPELGPEDRMTSVEFKLNFLGPARADGPALLARAETIRSGRTIALVRATATQDGRTVATGLFTYLYTRAG